MSAGLQPPTHHCFRAGEAVLCLGKQHQRQPLVPIRAVIIRDNSTWIHWPDGHISCVSHERLAYRGYCATCAVPAVLSNDQLVCPRCHYPAIDCPPPDELVVRWFPCGLVKSSMAAHRAAVNPAWTWQQAQREAVAASGIIDDLCYSFAEQLGLPALKQSSRLYNAECYLLHRMSFYAFFRDEEAYRAVYEELVRIQQESSEISSGLTILGKLLDFILDEDDDTPGRPSQRLALPPLDLQRTTEDSEPDGADDLTRWLDDQFGGGA